MLSVVSYLIILLSVFGHKANALDCPKKLNIEISAMDFSAPGSAYHYANEFTTVSKTALKYHTLIEEHIITQAQTIIKEPFELVEESARQCEYFGENDIRLSASIYNELQYVQPVIKGHPDQGSLSWRLVVRMPIYLARVGRDIDYRRRYINGTMNFYIWLEKGPAGLQATAYDNIAAMMKYQVDYDRTLYFYPLGQSTLDDVKVTAVSDKVALTSTKAVASLPSENQ